MKNKDFEMRVLGELKPGATYALQITKDYGYEKMVEYANILGEAANRAGIKLLVFAPDLKFLHPTEIKDIIK